MSNPLFQMFGKQNIMAMLPQLRSNPAQMLQRAGFNVPQNINSPQAIVEYLTRSGQLSQDQLNKAQSMANMFGVMK